MLVEARVKSNKRNERKTTQKTRDLEKKRKMTVVKRREGPNLDQVERKQELNQKMIQTM